MGIMNDISDFDIKGGNAYEDVDEQFSLAASRIDKRDPDHIVNNLNNSNTTSAHFQTKSQKEEAAPPHHKKDPTNSHVIYEEEELKYLDLNQTVQDQPQDAPYHECHKHKSNPLTLYCETCDEYICTKCLIRERDKHVDHTIHEIKDLYHKVKNDMRETIGHNDKAKESIKQQIQ